MDTIRNNGFPVTPADEDLRPGMRSGKAAAVSRGCFHVPALARHLLVKTAGVSGKYNSQTMAWGGGGGRITKKKTRNVYFSPL